MDLHELPTGSFQRHPWELARARFFRQLLRRARVLDRARDVLDIGAGDGYFAGELIAAMPGGVSAVCFDPNYTDEQLRALAVVNKALSFVRQVPAGRFDLVLLLDVLEHVPDDRDLLARTVSDSLSDGGMILLSVPAWMSLYTKHDEFLGHYRRYRPSALRKLVAAAGLQPVAHGGLFHSLLLVRVAQKLNERRQHVHSRPDVAAFGMGEQHGVGDWNKGPTLTRAISAMLAVDNQLSTASARLGLHLPALSTWTLCRKA
jgi:SAM-dependent methyltransferase